MISSRLETESDEIIYTHSGTNAFEDTNDGCCQCRVHNGAKKHCEVEDNAHNQ